MKILGHLTRMKNILMSPPAIMGVAEGGQRRFLGLVHWLVLACWQRAGGTADDSARTIPKWAATDLPTLALTAIPKTLLADWKTVGQNLLTHRLAVAPQAALLAGRRAPVLHTITTARICPSGRNAALLME
jgi:hypothetical protein